MCECDASCDSLCDPYKERTEMVSMRVCGDGSNYGSDLYPDKTFYASYIIQWPWKLIVNGSLAMTDACPNNANQYGAWRTRNSYVAYDGSEYETPNQVFFDSWYKPQIDAGRGHLYQSQCLDDMDGSSRINKPGFAPFVYEEFMLYNLETDKIEACNVAADHPNITQSLWEELQLQSLEYSVPQNVEKSPGAMWKQIQSYDCVSDTTFLVPWEGTNEARCGDFVFTKNDLNVRECSKIWKELNDLKTACYGGSPYGITESSAENSSDAYYYYLIFGTFVIIFCIGIVATYYFCSAKNVKLEKEIANIVKTPLTPPEMKQHKATNNVLPVPIAGAYSSRYANAIESTTHSQSSNSMPSAPPKFSNSVPSQSTTQNSNSVKLSIGGR